MIIRRWGAAAVLGFTVGALALMAPAAADHNPAVGGQFCGADHEDSVHTDEGGDWYVCEERDDDDQPRWYPTSEPDPTTEPSPEPPAEETPAAVEEGDPDDQAGDALPETGTPVGLIAGAAVALLLLGAGLYLVVRRRRVSFAA